MQQIILRGSKEFPWNENRKKLVQYFFTDDLLPENNPYTTKFLLKSTPNVSLTAIQQGRKESEEAATSQAATSQATTDQATTSQATTDQATTSRASVHQNRRRQARRPFKISKNDKCAAVIGGVSLERLLKAVIRDAVRRKKTSRGVHLLKFILNYLFKKRISCDSFRDALVIAVKTTNMNGIINLIRSRLQIPGIGYNIVPSVRSIQRSCTLLLDKFLALFKCERTFSGFRLDLLSCVRFAAYLVLGKDDLSNIHVDIWGDGCEIGGIEVTRLTFRIICSEISAQSANAVFCFAGTLL